MCKNSVIKAVSSPDLIMTKTAWLYRRDCGATTGWSTQLSLLPNGDTPKGIANIMVISDDVEESLAASWGGAWADMEWTGPTSLTIYSSRSGKILKSETRLDGIVVSYKFAETPRSSRPN